MSRGKRATRRMLFLSMALLPWPLACGPSQSPAQREAMLRALAQADGTLDRARQAHAKLVALHEITRAILTTESEIRQLERSVLRVMNRLPRGNEAFTAPVKEVSRLAAANRLRCTTDRRSAASEHGPIGQAPWQMRMNGSLQDFRSFLDALEASSVLTRIDRMQVVKEKADGSELTASFLLTVPFRPDPVAPPRAPHESAAAGADQAALEPTGEHETISAIRGLPRRIDTLSRQVKAFLASPPSDTGEADGLLGQVCALSKDADDLLARESRKPAHLEELKRTRETMLARARLAESLLQRVSWASVLNELTAALPGDCCWLRCETDAPPAAGTGDQDSSGTIRLGVVGLGPGDVQVAAYIAALSASTLFQDVRLVSVQDHRGDGEARRMFRINLGVVATGGDPPDRLAAR